jgi:hypothetical protein
LQNKSLKEEHTTTVVYFGKIVLMLLYYSKLSLLYKIVSLKAGFPNLPANGLQLGDGRAVDRRNQSPSINVKHYPNSSINHCSTIRVF